MKILMLILVLLTACSQQDETTQVPSQVTPAQPVTVERRFDAVQIERGRQLFLTHCATCHGANAQGAPAWHIPDANGKNPPPPLNGTGHAWHHPKKALVSTIKYGTTRIGGNMPAWEDKLSDQEIDDIITWFQSQWPDELYAAWQRTDQQSMQ